MTERRSPGRPDRVAAPLRPATRSAAQRRRETAREPLKRARSPSPGPGPRPPEPGRLRSHEDAGRRDADRPRLTRQTRRPLRNQVNRCASNRPRTVPSVRRRGRRSRRPWSLPAGSGLVGTTFPGWLNHPRDPRSASPPWAARTNRGHAGLVRVRVVRMPVARKRPRRRHRPGAPSDPTMRHPWNQPLHCGAGTDGAGDPCRDAPAPHGPVLHASGWRPAPYPATAGNPPRAAGVAVW